MKLRVKLVNTCEVGEKLVKPLISGRGGYNYQSVRRWTTQRKLGYSLLECDKIFVPIHQEIHWCLAIINKKEEKFQYLDSLRGVDSLEDLARYYVDEVKDKTGKDIDVSSWKQEFVKDLPNQENGSHSSTLSRKSMTIHSYYLDTKEEFDPML
ncbi:hypothetical protein RD792_005532 [Penstemon davidsonii]|uniref:Ubiquitin-like protease family profile domain-containing protein n=1 Tax=Penstemon davidsonii TaxID=160366 RepID=A0ABR0DEY5_9LAMI|nr:hypothetical protein RD792_005532 [Penstemon davidsonii]